MTGKRNILAMTLVEMLLALVIIAILSTAIATMLTGAAKTSLYVTTSADTVTQMETAYRRILHNCRTASVLTTPANTTAISVTPTSSTPVTNLIVLKTQPDPSNSNAARDVTYYIQGTDLKETDTLYGTGNIILRNVTSISVQLNSTTAPKTITLNVTACDSTGGVTNGKLTVNRSVTIYCRNL